MTTVTGLLSTLACALLVSGCAPSTQSGAGAGGGNVPSSVELGVGDVTCKSLLDRVTERERQGDTSGDINAELDALGDHCPSEYRVFADYASIKSFAKVSAGGSCSEYGEFDVAPAAIELARRDGFCSSSDSDSDSDSDSGSGSSGLGAADWSCSYQPTYNDDWHDDVICSDGDEVQRPYLREWDNYITEDEIMESARDHEQHLNGG